MSARESPAGTFLYLTLTHLTPHLKNIYSLLRSTVDPSPALTTVNQTNHTDLCQIQTSDINICISLFLLLDQQITQGVFKKYHVWALYWSFKWASQGQGPNKGIFLSSQVFHIQDCAIIFYIPLYEWHFCSGCTLRMYQVLESINL